MSLRARLLVGLVVLPGMGLAAAAVATYEEQRSFLLARVDKQVASLAVISLAPAGSAALWWTATPRAISSGALARALPAGSTAISLPFWDPEDRSLYAQATSGMRFRLVDQWAQNMPRRYQRLVASINRLTEPSGARASRSRVARAARLERELTAAGIQYVIVWDSNNAATRLMATLHLKPERVDGSLIYRLPGRSAKSAPAHRHRSASSQTPTTPRLEPRAKMLT